MENSIERKTKYTQSELECLDETLLFQIALSLNGGRGIFPKGVFRFKTFEEAQAWNKKHIIQSILKETNTRV